MHDTLHDEIKSMFRTFRQFRFHILAILLLCLAHGAVGLFGADLPPDAAKLVSQSDTDIAKVRSALVRDLSKAMAKYTKAGNLDAANAVKAKMDDTNKLLGDSGDLLGGAPNMKERANASYEYALPNQRGTLKLSGGQASIPGHSGTLVVSDSTITITWNNGTTWTIDSAMILTASDGTSKLTAIK